MILVDTSVWIDHLREREPGLTSLLNDSQVLVHPMVIGELACGSLRNRDEVLGLLSRLPKIPTATDDEVLLFIERRRVMRRGIGYVDAHLLAATALAEQTLLWTEDRRLVSVATDLDLAYTPRAEIRPDAGQPYAQ